MRDELMNVKELADYLRLSRLTIYRWAKAGAIPACKVGKGWRFRKSRIDKMLGERTRGD